ncbi:MAG: hypothetical protein LBB40_02625 [Holophagales bacterium]|jgi:predicted nucleic acid-binding protein|nr:hypothetical protein [Holophagales bacterium]
MEARRKLRIYFDTTIPNYLFQNDRPDWMAYTWQLWERCEAGEFEIFVSDVLFDELAECPEPKLSKMREKMASIQMKLLAESDGVTELASEYIRSGALTRNSLNDCLHIAFTLPMPLSMTVILYSLGTLTTHGTGQKERLRK